MLVQLAPFLFGLFYGSGFVIVSECMLVCAISVCVFAHSLISKVIKSLFIFCSGSVLVSVVIMHVLNSANPVFL